MKWAVNGLDGVKGYVPVSGGAWYDVAGSGSEMTARGIGLLEPGGNVFELSFEIIQQLL